MSCDVAFTNFQSIYEEFYNTNFNEADTRAKIIDRVLKECLFFSEKSITREQKTNEGYIDYLIQKNSNFVCVIEAKKQGIYFELSVDKRRHYKINGALSTSDSVISAINQVQGYCSDIGCQFAIITNGNQWIAFKAICLGKSWRNENAYCFSSLDDIKENFLEFYNEFSAKSYEEGRFLRNLFNGFKLTYRRISDEIHNIDEELIRNELYLSIRRMTDIFLGELLDDGKKDILEACYISEKTKNEIDLLSNFFLPYKIKESKSFEKEFGTKTYKKEYDLMLLLGGIGSGKSTFIHNFFKIKLKNEKLVWFYLDFRECLPHENEIKDYIVDQVFLIWKKQYGHIIVNDDVYFNERDKSAYLVDLFNYLKQNDYLISLVIDNVDQHEKVFQEKLFIKSSEITKEFEVITILAIRKETFYISTKTGVFDAYRIPKFHIPSPDFLELVLKRLEYCILRLRENNIDVDEKDKDKIITFFNTIRNSLLSKNRQSSRLNEFIHMISIGNMRNALDMFNNFLTSGNVNIYEILSEERYQIAYHQFLKAILLANNKYYKGDRSSIINLYDIDTSITNSHFNCLRLLNYLNERANKKTQIGRGYLNINEIICVADEVSIKKEVIFYSLSVLTEDNLVELDNQTKKDISSASYVKITPAGIFYLNTLSNLFDLPPVFAYSEC